MNNQMQRFTISLDDHLAAHFDDFIALKGYVNRSEAVRDLLRERLDRVQLQVKKGQPCMATVSYVYDDLDQTVSMRILTLQHDHHDFVISNMRTQLAHSDCMETVVLKGEMSAVLKLAEQLIASRGVRHGNVHVVPLVVTKEVHSHTHNLQKKHTHLKPIS
jgi:CopG family nickel-responsive transcriptional regulator